MSISEGNVDVNLFFLSEVRMFEYWIDSGEYSNLEETGVDFFNFHNGFI